jgi:hypothetical protein
MKDATDELPCTGPPVDDTAISVDDAGLGVNQSADVKAISHVTA